MTRMSYVIFSSLTAWHLGVNEGTAVRLVPVAASPQAPVDDQVLAIAAALTAEGWKGQSVIWAIGSHQCLSAPLSLDKLPRRHHGALLYEVEDLVPVPAEDLVADFLIVKERAFCVCAETARLSALLRSFETHGILIEYICPAAVLALQSLCKGNDDRYGAGVVVWRSTEALELFVMDGGRPTLWHSIPDDHTSLRERLLLLEPGLSAPYSMTLVGHEPDQLRTELADLPALPPETVQRGLHQAAVETADAVSSGRCKPWINLRRDTLAVGDSLRNLHVPILAALAAAIIFLACTAAGLLVRASRNDAAAGEQHTIQRQLVKQLLSKASDDSSPITQLAIEERRQRGLSGTAGSAPSTSSALSLLHQACTAVPPTLRIRLLDIRVDPDKIYLDGETRTHGDAESLAQALRSIPGWSVDAPRSEQRGDKTVTFTLTVGIPAPSTSGARP